MVERTIPEGLEIPPGQPGRERLHSIVTCNTDRRVTWICSYVSADRRTMYCVYEAPTPEAIRLTGRASGLPVDRITAVTILDPYPFPIT